MYDDFNEYILEFINGEKNSVEDYYWYTSDYWSDVAVDTVSDIIEKFNEEDWEILMKELPIKSKEWREKLAYCLGDKNNLNHFEVLLELVNTDDDDVYWTSLDSLSIYRDKNTIKKILVENPYFITKIKELIPNSNIRAKKLYEEFLIKLDL